MNIIERALEKFFKPKKYEVALAKSGNKDAMHLLLKQVTPLIGELSKSFSKSGTNDSAVYEDAIQNSLLVIYKYILKHNQNDPIFYSSLAYHVKWAINHTFVEYKPFKFSQKSRKNYHSIMKAKVDLMSKGKESTIDELSIETGIDQKEIALYLSLSEGVQSLNQRVDPENNASPELIDTIEDEKSQFAEGVVDKLYTYSLIEALKALDSTDELIFMLTNSSDVDDEIANFDIIVTPHTRRQFFRKFLSIEATTRADIPPLQQSSPHYNRRVWKSIIDNFVAQMI